MNNSEVTGELLRRRRVDLDLRADLLSRGELNEGYHPEMRRVHEDNADYLARVIDHHGFPTAARVGEEAKAAAWLIVLHAISRPAFLRRCRDLLAAEADQSLTDRRHLAYLTDRIAVFSGEPQRYGTQFDWNDAGRLVPNPYDDRDAVDRRRAELDLPSLAEQSTLINERTRAEGGRPPADLAAHRSAFERWRKHTGWLSE